MVLLLPPLPRAPHLLLAMQRRPRLVGAQKIILDKRQWQKAVSIGRRQPGMGSSHQPTFATARSANGALLACAAATPAIRQPASASSEAARPMAGALAVEMFRAPLARTPRCSLATLHRTLLFS